MKSVLTIFLTISICVVSSTPAHAFQSSAEDSLFAIKSTITAEGKARMKKRPKLLKRIADADSTIDYVCNKNGTEILSVQSFDRAKNLFVEYLYNDWRVFRILVLKRSDKENRNSKSSYFFANRKLIYSINKNELDDLQFLIKESDRFLIQGAIILKSVRSNPIPKI